MKNIIKLTSILIILLILTSCVKESLSPEETVTNALNATINMDKKAMEEHFYSYKLEEDDLLKHGVYADLFVKNLSFNIISSQIDDESAVVETEISNLDFGPIFVDWANFALELTQYGQKEVENLPTIMEDKMNELVNRENNEIYKSTININLIKENNRWQVDRELILVDAMFHGLISLEDDMIID